MSFLLEIHKQELIIGAVCAIFNPEGKVLLLRRSIDAGWMPNKYCFPGGHVEKDEKPIDGAKREVFEETKIKLNKSQMRILTSFIENEYFVTVFATEIDHSKVTLNEEHDKYKWCSYNECLILNTVPNTKETISILNNKNYFSME